MPVKNPLRGTQLQLPGTEALTEPPAAPPAPEPKLKSWCYTPEAVQRLEISADKLKRLRRSGSLKEGHHYRDTAGRGAGRPTYQYHVPRMEAWLNKPKGKK